MSKYNAQYVGPQPISPSYIDFEELNIINKTLKRDIVEVVFNLEEKPKRTKKIKETNNA